MCVDRFRSMVSCVSSFDWNGCILTVRFKVVRDTKEIKNADVTAVHHYSTFQYDNRDGYRRYLSNQHDLPTGSPL